MRVTLVTNKESFRNEYEDVIRAFSPYVELVASGGEIITCDVTVIDDEVRVEISLGDKQEMKTYRLDAESELMQKRLLKRYSKRDLYGFISDTVGVKLPYGSLTGIRPTKLFYELTEEGRDARAALVDFFKVSDSKAALIADIVDTQKGIYAAETDKVDWFVNIPFCPSKCKYCSFISEVINAKKSNLDGYVDVLCRDIDSARDLLPSRRAIYVGGGTPTSLPPELLAKVLAKIEANGKEEFTVEAGRPETITEEMIDVLSAANVTRISINPQTFKQETLDIIGRKHTVEDIFKAYELVRKRGKFDVNMDFITMLPGETFDDFKYSIDTAVALSPENITVHSLSIKRGSVFAEAGYDNFSDGLAARMSDYARASLYDAGYMPYYMYRQKNTTGRLENVGYAKRNKVCKYNVDIMEETHSIYASGAGAISKRLYGGGLIERLAEVKEIKGYIDRAEETLDKKNKFFGG